METRQAEASENPGAAQRVSMSAHMFCSPGICSIVKLNSVGQRGQCVVLCTTWRANFPL